MKSRVVDNSALRRWQAASASDILLSLSDYAKRDLSFFPTRDRRTSRWHATVGGRDVELVCTGSKFYDTHARRGGAGAVDLTMHLFRVDFVKAVRLLKARGL